MSKRALDEIGDRLAALTRYPRAATTNVFIHRCTEIEMVGCIDRDRPALWILVLVWLVVVRGVHVSKEQDQSVGTVSIEIVAV